jgi:ketosteroid isomerase-like protein
VTRDPVDILDRGYELIWRHDDAEAAFRGVTPDFEWIVPGHPEGDVRRGAEGAIQFFREWVEPWEELHVDWELHRAGRDGVLAVVAMRGRGRESGAPIDVRVGQLWTFRGSRAARMVMYSDVQKAFEAAGLRR